MRPGEQKKKLHRENIFYSTMQNKFHQNVVRLSSSFVYKCFENKRDNKTKFRHSENEWLSGSIKINFFFIWKFKFNDELIEINGWKQIFKYIGWFYSLPWHRMHTEGASFLGIWNLVVYQSRRDCIGVRAYFIAGSVKIFRCDYDSRTNAK